MYVILHNKDMKDLNLKFLYGNVGSFVRRTRNLVPI
jgi:hypothetical protein